MKKRLLLASMTLLFVAAFTSCKKQDENALRTKMIGKWQVNKIDVATYIDGSVPTVVSTSYAATDYIDFKNNESDDFELSLGNTRTVGSFSSTVDNKIYLDFPSKDLDCTVNTISGNQFQLTGTVVGSSPKVTETYYLSR